MSLAFAAFVPHPPIAIPAIGKDAAKKITKTIEALAKIEEELYLAHPDVIVIFSPHGTIFKDAFSINVCTDYETDLREFGDLTTRLVFKGEPNLASKIRHATKESNVPTTMVSDPKLDHGLSVPLFFITRHLPEIPIIPISPSELDWKTHMEFGYLIKEQIMTSNKRVAVIASGDLSHALSTDAPAGFNQAGAEFDAKIQELLASSTTAGLLQLDQKMTIDAAECGLRCIFMLMGVLRGVNYTYTAHAYEAPFGVGYLTAQFSI